MLGSEYNENHTSLPYSYCIIVYNTAYTIHTTRFFQTLIVIIQQDGEPVTVGLVVPPLVGSDGLRGVSRASKKIFRGGPIPWYMPAESTQILDIDFFFTEILGG